MNYDIQKLILSFVSHNTLPTIVNNPTLFDVVLEDKYWKREASKYSIKKTPLGIHYCKLKSKLCEECNKNGKSYFDYILCSNCKKSDKYSTISLTKAKREYYLTDEKLTQITKETCYYQKYSKYITIYLKSDIDDISDKLLIQEKNAKKLERQERKKRLVEVRKLKIENELKKYDVKFDETNIICRNYLNGSKKLSTDDIANELCIQKYLNEYTNYQDIMEDEISNISWSWNNYRDLRYISSFIREEILENLGEWPKPWPWL